VCSVPLLSELLLLDEPDVKEFGLNSAVKNVCVLSSWRSVPVMALSLTSVGVVRSCCAVLTRA